MPQKLLLSKKKYKNKQTRKHLYLSYISYHHRESDELKPCPQLLNISFFSSPFYSVSTAQPHLSIYNTGLNGRILLPSPLSPLFFFFNFFFCITWHLILKFKQSFVPCLPCAQKCSECKAPAHSHPSVFLPDGRKKAGQDADEMNCFKLHLALLVWRKHGSLCHFSQKKQTGKTFKDPFTRDLSSGMFLASELENTSCLLTHICFSVDILYCFTSL